MSTMQSGQKPLTRTYSERSPCCLKHMFAGPKAEAGGPRFEVLDEPADGAVASSAGLASASPAPMGPCWRPNRADTSAGILKGETAQLGLKAVLPSVACGPRLCLVGLAPAPAFLSSASSFAWLSYACSGWMGESNCHSLHRCTDTSELESRAESSVASKTLLPSCPKLTPGTNMWTSVRNQKEKNVKIMPKGVTKSERVKSDPVQCVQACWCECLHASSCANVGNKALYLMRVRTASQTLEQRTWSQRG